MGASKHSDDDDLLLALQHTMRRQILRYMLDKEEASPREIATALDLALSNVSYHVRVLASRGAIDMVRTQQVRGSLQHFYSPSLDAPWAQQVLGLTKSEDEQGENRGKSGA